MPKKAQSIHYHDEVPDFLKGLSGERKQRLHDEDGDRERNRRRDADDAPQIVVLRKGDLTVDEVNQLKKQGYSLDSEQEDNPIETESRRESLKLEENEERVKKALEDYEKEIGKHLFRKPKSIKKMNDPKLPEFHESSRSHMKPHNDTHHHSQQEDILSRKPKRSKLSFEEDE